MSRSRQKRSERSPRTVKDDLIDFCKHDSIVQEIMKTVEARTGHHCTSIAPMNTHSIYVTFSRANEAQFLHWSNRFERWEHHEYLHNIHRRKCHSDLLTRFLMRLAATNLLSQLEDETRKVLYNYEVEITEQNVFWSIEFRSRTFFTTRKQYENGSISVDYRNAYITVKERDDLIVSPRSRLTIISRDDRTYHGLPPPTMIGFDSEGLGRELEVE